MPKKTTTTKSAKIPKKISNNIKELVGVPLNSPAFMQKLVDAMGLYAIKIKDEFIKDYPQASERFPKDSYMTLEEALIPKKKTTKKQLSLASLKKKKPNIINQDTESDNSSSEEENTESEPEQDEKPPGKKGRKSGKGMPFGFSKNIKSMLSYIIAKFRYDIYMVEEIVDYPNKQDEIQNYLLENVPKKHPDCNVVELIIHTVNRYDIDKILPESHGLNMSIQEILKDIKHIQIIAYSADILTKFIKLITIFIMNDILLDKRSSISVQTFNKIMLDMFVGVKNLVKSSLPQIWINMQKYDATENPKKDSAQKSNKSCAETTDKKEDPPKDKEKKSVKATDDPPKNKEKKLVKATDDLPKEKKPTPEKEKEKEKKPTPEKEKEKKSVKAKTSKKSIVEDSQSEDDNDSDNIQDELQ